MNRITKNFKVDASTNLKLAELAKTQERSVSQILRNALKSYILQNAKEETKLSENYAGDRKSRNFQQEIN